MTDLNELLNSCKPYVKSLSIKDDTQVRMARGNQIKSAELSALRAIAADSAPTNADVYSALAGFPATLAEDIFIHANMPYKATAHIKHNAIYALCCSDAAEKYVSANFEGAVFAPASEEMSVIAKAVGSDTTAVFAENGDLFVTADEPDKALAYADKVIEKLTSAIAKRESSANELSDESADRAAYLAPIFRVLCGDAPSYGIVRFSDNEDVIKTGAKNRMTYRSAKLLGGETLNLAYDCSDDDIRKAFDDYRAKHGFSPKAIFVSGLGLFVWGETLKKANKALASAEASCRAELDCAAFGKPSPVDPAAADRLHATSPKARRSGRLAGKIAIVTGAAQGFGRGIAEAMAKEGAYVVVADMNYEGALATASTLDGASAVSANVTDEESVKHMVRDTVMAYGGLDVFVNNAGIVRAGSLEEMTKQNFELVTSVNYTAYFICAKYACIPMKLQSRFAPEYISDIIEINSKSGLTGSNKNFAYAGSKFGGLGLTQSFALELAPYRIKVNAVCPGNFLDGPLWSDPEKGLFVQYLHAGKVPGAKTVDDVRRFYEAKVPLNRGCRTIDVARAIFYIIEQEYETGQAVPVTGGQEMIN